MSDEQDTIDAFTKSQRQVIEQVKIPDHGPISVMVRNATRELKVDSAAFEYTINTKGNPIRVASQGAGWIKKGLPRPGDKSGLNKLSMVQGTGKKRALGSLTVYPSIDPTSPKTRALWRLLMTENSWIQRANVIIQKLVMTRSSSEVEPRKEQEISEDKLEAWKKKEITVPLWNKKMTPTAIKQWVDRLYHKLDGPSVFFNGYLIQREQGRCAIGMFPETRGETGDYVIPKALRYIEPEFTRRPILDFDTGELQAIEIIGLTSNGGRLDANRAIYMTNADNLNLFARFYGRSDVEPVMDIGKTLLTIYTQDFPHAAEFTWHKPNIYRLMVPARDWDKVEKVQNDFNNKLQDNAGKDISVTQAVELLNPGAGSNTGNISGLIEIQNECIDAIAGYYNIPPFLLAKGKPGRLGGNANREEIDAFLEIEIRPEQEIVENIVEKQFYDRVLAILFQVEPEEVENDEKVPIRIRHFFDKPNIAAAIDVEQYEISKDMVREGMIDMSDLVEKFNIRSDINDDTVTEGEDVTPTIKTWERKNKAWGKPRLNKKALAWKPTNIQVHNRGKWPGAEPSQQSSKKSSKWN